MLYKVQTYFRVVECSNSQGYISFIVVLAVKSVLINARWTLAFKSEPDLTMFLWTGNK